MFGWVGVFFFVINGAKVERNMNQIEDKSKREEIKRGNTDTKMNQEEEEEEEEEEEKRDKKKKKNE